MPLTRRHLLGSATALALTTTLSTSTRARAASVNSRFGFAAPSVQLHNLNDSDLSTYMQTARATGAQHIRFDFRWNVVEGIAQGQRDWTETDRFVNAILAAGMTPVAIINTCPFWASTPGSDPASENRTPNPAKLTAFASFVNAAATRYKDRIRNWEIWNEPNLTVFWPAGPNAQAYTQLLKSAYAEIKKIQPASGSTVITAGLASVFSSGGNIAMDTFLQGVYTSGGRNYFDAVGAHPYTFPYDATDPARPSIGYDGWAKTLAMRNIMTTQGDSAKKMWITEVGYPVGTASGAVTEDQQSTFLRNTVSGLLAQDFISTVLVYTLVDPGSEVGGHDLRFGLIREDRTFRPAYYMIKQLNGN